MKRLGWSLVFLAATMISAVNAGADVLYQLTANNVGQVIGHNHDVNITLTQPTFINGFTLDLFSNTPSATCDYGGATCIGFLFAPYYQENARLEIYTLSTLGDFETDIFSFPTGAFFDFGTYHENVCDFDCLGHNAVLTVSESVNVNETPEPGTLALLGTGLLGFAGPLRRKLTF